MSTLTPRHDQRMICDTYDVAHVPEAIGSGQTLCGESLLDGIPRDLCELLANRWELVSDRGFRYPAATACQTCLHALDDAEKREAAGL